MNNSIIIIIEKNTEARYKEFISNLPEIKIPTGYTCKIVSLIGAEDRFSAYNDIICKYKSSFKIYISDKVERIKEDTVLMLLSALIENDDYAMAGVQGAILPLNGDLHNTTSMYGMYSYKNDGEYSYFYGKKNIFDQEVDVIDSGIFATSMDISWDFELENFALAAHCMKMKSLGKSICVIMSDTPMASYISGSDFDIRFKNSMYEKYHTMFYQKYINELNPLVSILIPTYNSPEYFRQALESALNQDYPNIEIIVGDDSTDNRTAELIKKYNDYHQIKYYNHGGPLGEKGYYNWQFLLNKAEGNFINYLLHDDLFKPNKISKMMEILKADINNEIGAVTSARSMIDSDGRTIALAGPWHPTENTLLKGNEIIYKILFNNINFIGECTTVLQRRDTFHVVEDDIMLSGYYYEMNDRYMVDTALWLDILRHRDIMFLPDELSAFRIHNNQKTNDMSMVCGCVINWLNFIVITWLHGEFIKGQGLLYKCLKQWSVQHKDDINRCLESNLTLMMMETLKAMYEGILHQEYSKVVSLSIQYMMDNCDAERIANFCVKDKNGLWRRR